MSLRLSDVVFLIRQELGDQPILINKLRQLEKRLSTPKRRYERKERYKPEEILVHIKDNPHRDDVRVFDGDEIHMDSLRYQVFKRSLCCVKCGLTGSFFAKEISHSRDNRQATDKTTGEKFDRWHFNLYAVKPDGTEVIMTKDHIIPLSKGGSNNLNNLQTMCGPCNWKKGNKCSTTELSSVS